MSAVSLKPLAVLAFAGTALLAGCKPAAAPQAEPAKAATAEPTAHVSRTARLQAFLTARYGKDAKLSGEWRGTWTQEGETRPVDWQVCAEQPVVTGDSWQQLLAVCGALADGAHIDPGTIDFFVLHPKGEGFDVASELTGERFGSGGQPGSASIIRAGSDFYGFRVEDGWFGQGFSLLSQTLVLPGPNGLVATGNVRSHIDNDAQYECENVDATADPDTAEDCRTRRFSIDFALRFDDSDRSARVWPLLIEETGSTCGGKRVRQEHRFTLDPKSWTYSFPESLRREGCE
ncbi:MULTISPECIES: hypothetical protein [unclassified Stenotrophomonas]|uniref:hypothetical protein n=1 Tax=unclassified Stenotrophomonas TaxID=196198 RepID=UPI0034651A44